MNLLDKYILEISNRLPLKNRQDILSEIRSTLEDMLEDRSRQAGRPVDEGLIAEVLQEYGSPAKVAGSYSPTRFLIGPRLYPFFAMVLKIVLTVLAVVTLVGFGINASQAGAAGNSFLSTVGTYAAQLFTNLIAAFGNIVLVFAILERVLPPGALEDKQETWTPADLDAEPDPSEVKRSEPVFEIIFTAIALALFNLYPNLIGFTSLKDGAWVSVPALSEAFFRYLPWINLLGILTILLQLYLLVRGRWQGASQVASLAVDAAGIVLAVVMLTGPALVSLDPARMAEIFGSSAVVITRMLTLVPYLVLVVLIIVESIEAAQTLWRMLRMPRPGSILPGR